jgi:hypothetical protein
MEESFIEDVVFKHNVRKLLEIIKNLKTLFSFRLKFYIKILLKFIIKRETYSN